MIPPAVWTIDGIPTLVDDWSANARANHGFDQMRGTMLASEARRLSSVVRQGSVVKAFTMNRRQFWEGALSAPPSIHGDLAVIGAQGEASTLEKAHDRLNFQTRNYSDLTESINPPHSDLNATPSKIHLGINDGGVLFTLEPGGADLGVGGYVAAVFWAPGSIVTRVAYDCLASFADANFKIELWTGNGPSLSGMTQRLSTGIGATAFSVDSGSWGQAVDEVLLMLVWRGGAPVALGAGHVLIKSLRINGIAAGDSFWPWQVFHHVAGRNGYDVTEVDASGLNILPNDWQSSHAELLTYIAGLEDRHWGLFEDKHLRYRSWGEKEWTVYQADGTTLDLVEMEVYNRVVVKYVDVGGAPRQVSLDANPNPLAGTPQVKVYEIELSEVQTDSTLATAIANTALPYVSSPRETGVLNISRAYDFAGRDASLEIRPGHTIRLADAGPSQSRIYRAHDVGYSPRGVSVGTEALSFVEALTGRAALDKARLPSTMGLPALEAVIADEPEPLPEFGSVEERLEYAGIAPERMEGQHRHHGRNHRHIQAGFGGHVHHGRWHIHG